jgi:hypothetical protein
MLLALSLQWGPIGSLTIDLVVTTAAAYAG